MSVSNERRLVTIHSGGTGCVSPFRKLRQRRGATVLTIVDGGGAILRQPREPLACRCALATPRSRSNTRRGRLSMVAEVAASHKRSLRETARTVN
jgi:hypothetical protein